VNVISSFVLRLLCCLLSSDDDLEPYDMSADQPNSKVATPAYIRDCMEGLVSSEQPEHVQVSLAVSAQLIRSSTTGVKEVCAYLRLLLSFSCDRLVRHFTAPTTM